MQIVGLVSNKQERNDIIKIHKVAVTGMRFRCMNMTTMIKD